MSIIAWIVLGLIAGFVASKIVNKSGEGMILDIILGIVGAVLGGYLFQTFGMPGVTGINLYSILVAVVGAVVFLVIYHAIFRRSARVYFNVHVAPGATKAASCGRFRSRLQ
jgi:uncharacterized membrane protein YeaQ/YmgE (transglycosylase-associated protein family)